MSNLPLSNQSQREFVSQRCNYVTMQSHTIHGTILRWRRSTFVDRSDLLRCPETFRVSDFSVFIRKRRAFITRGPISSGPRYPVDRTRRGGHKAVDQRIEVRAIARNYRPYNSRVPRAPFRSAQPGVLRNVAPRDVPARMSGLDGHHARNNRVRG